MTKIAVLGLTGILLSLFLKDTKPQFAVFVSMTTCILIFFYAVEKLLYLTGTLETIRGYVNLKGAYFETLMKIVGITYVADFSASLCKDAGFGAIAGQIEFFGKISVLALSTPVLLALFETIQAFLK
mgnify:CR=1 FL=1